MDQESKKIHRKRGNSRNHIEIPKRLLDRLTPEVLEALPFEEVHQFQKRNFLL